MESLAQARQPVRMFRQLKAKRGAPGRACDGVVKSSEPEVKSGAITYLPFRDRHWECAREMILKTCASIASTGGQLSLVTPKACPGNEGDPNGQIDRRTADRNDKELQKRRRLCATRLALPKLPGSQRPFLHRRPQATVAKPRTLELLPPRFPPMDRQLRVALNLLFKAGPLIHGNIATRAETAIGAHKRPNHGKNCRKLVIKATTNQSAMGTSFARIRHSCGSSRRRSKTKLADLLHHEQPTKPQTGSSGPSQGNGGK